MRSKKTRRHRTATVSSARIIARDAPRRAQPALPAAVPACAAQPGTSGQARQVTPLDLLLAALAGVPALPGARGRGRHHLFDAARVGEDAEVLAARHRQALSLCARCPALQRSAVWYGGLPARRARKVWSPGIRIPNPRKEN
jgi:hypothetical protein